MSTSTERLYEPILNGNNSRFTQFPIKYPDIHELYERSEANFWSSKEIDYKADLKDWVSLTDDERYFIEHILAFFAGSDGIVFENLVGNFCTEVKIPEARNVYGFQAMMENIHGQVYSLLIETLISDEKRKEVLFNAIDKIPCIGKKAEWAMKWFSRDRPFEERLIAFAIVEGVFFSGAFCSIFWLKNRQLMVRGLGASNDLIARDEGMHVEFAVLLYKYIQNKASFDKVKEIMEDAVKIEIEFICDSLPCRLIGMNSDLMTEYIQYVADRLMVQLGYQKIYNKENPFPFMTNLSLDSKDNFFEKRSTSYQHGSIAFGRQEDWKSISEVEF